MEISSEDLDKILSERYGSNRPNTSVNDISTHLTSFLEHVSGLEGAEHPLLVLRLFSFETQLCLKIYFF